MDNKKVTVLTAGGVGNTAGTSGNNSRNSRKKNKSTKQKQQQQQQQNSTSKPSPRRVTSEKPNDVALSSAAATAAAAAAAATTTTTTATTAAPNQEQAQNSSSPPSNLSGVGSLEYHTDEDENILGGRGNDNVGITDPVSLNRPYSDYPTTPAATSGGDAPPPRSSPLQGSPTGLPTAAESSTSTSTSQFVWLFICFFGIMASFVAYGLLLEYATSGGRTLHELSFLFVTSGLYTITAAAGRYVRDETPTTIAPSRFAILGLTSMGSTFFSVRSLRYVIYPIQVLAKSCKPVPVMLMGAIMGKKYPLRKYINVCLIVAGVALFMGGGDKKKKSGGDDEGGGGMAPSPSQLIGIILLFISLCFDGGTGAYEDKLMSVHSVQPFDLMYNIQLGKTILAGIGLLVLNQMHLFVQMCQEMGFLLIGLGLSGALGQVFIFVTIAKFGALTCSIIGLARKVVTLVFSIYFYGHHLNGIQWTGLMVCIISMVLDFVGKKKGGGKGHGGGGHGGGDDKKSATLTSSSKDDVPEELQKMLVDEEQPHDTIELTTSPTKVLTAGTVAGK